MKINKKFSVSFFVFLGCLFPLIPIFLLFSFYYLPKEVSPNVIQLTGTWQAQYNGVTKPVTLPALFYSPDGKGLIPEYKGNTWDVTLHRKVVLKESMHYQELFLMVCGTIFQTGRVLVNGEFVGDIGVFQRHRKFGTMQGIDGFLIEKKLLMPTNEITLKLESDDLTSFGINDQRLYLGKAGSLRPYYEKNLFLNNFFNFGVVFFSLFMLIVLTIMTITEWKSPDRSKYLITGLYVLSSLLYNLFYSGSFVNYVLPIRWLSTGIVASISLVVLTNLEFIYSVFVEKKGLTGRIALRINQVVCLGSAALYIFFTNNNYIFNLVWNNFSIYFIISVLFGLIIIIRSIFKNRNPYGLVMGVANLMFILSSVNDVLSNQSIINSPLIGNVGISVVTIIGTIIVIAEFVKISNTLKEKVEERTKELHTANEELNTAYIELTKKQKQIQQELSIAKLLQLSIVPNPETMPKVPGLEIGTSYHPMEEIGGDLADVIRIGKYQTGFLVSDVSGHGVPAALISMMVKTTFNYHAHPDKKTDVVMTQINDEMVKLIGDVEQYFTAYFGVLDTANSKFSYTNGGHHPAVLYKDNEKKLYQLDTKGTLMGSIPGLTYQRGEVQLGKGDGIVLYTDGIVEARNEKKEMYEESRFFDFILKNGHRPAQEFIDRHLKELDAFCGNRLADDDRTILYIKIS